MVAVLVMSGRVGRVKKETKNWSGGTFEDVTIFIEFLGGTEYVSPGRHFGDLPAEGDEVSLVVVPRPYINRLGEPKVGWTAKCRYVEPSSAVRRVASAS